MNTTVNQLLDVDRQARQMLDEAQQYYDRTIREIDTERETLREEYAAKGDRHLHELETEQQRELAEAVAHTTQQATRIRAEMDARYEEGHAAWEDELFQRTIL